MNASIVIPNWNGKDKLEKNLPQVLEVEGVDEVIVVDDKSTDDSVNFLQTRYPQIKLIQKNKNEGFASTVNVGVKNARADFVFLLNTDAVPKKDCLNEVINHFDNPKVFSVSCNTEGNWSWARFTDGFFWHFQAEHGEKLETHETLWSSGGSGIFRKDLWEKLGGLDEVFNPFYEEDVDLGYRAVKRGYINLWEPKAQVEHYRHPGVIAQNFSKEYISKIAQRNQLLFIWKNITSKNMINKHLIALLRKLFLNPSYWLTFISALNKYPKISEARAKEKKEMVLSDEEILNKFKNLP